MCSVGESDVVVCDGLAGNALTTRNMGGVLPLGVNGICTHIRSASTYLPHFPCLLYDVRDERLAEAIIARFNGKEFAGQALRVERCENKDGYRNHQSPSYLGSLLMPREKRCAIRAIYVWCRRTDALVDASDAATMEPAQLHHRLNQWEERTRRLFAGEASDAQDMALRDTLQRLSPGHQAVPGDDRRAADGHQPEALSDL